MIHPSEPDTTSTLDSNHGSNECHHHHHHGVLGEWTELVFAIACGVFLIVGWGSSFFEAVPTWGPLVCYWVAYACGGYFIVIEAVGKLSRGIFEIDFLMIVAAIGAAILGAWAEGALLLFLFSLGHALEHYAMGRARQAIEALSKLAPDTAIRLTETGEEEVPVESLAISDTIIIKTNERIPADGFVSKGTSSVDQSPITGESIPVDKSAVVDVEDAARDPGRLNPCHRVFAGTINQQGTLEVRVTQLASESTLARVVKLVNEAEGLKSPTQHFTDRIEKFYVPLVIVVVILLHFAFLVIDEQFSDSFYRAMAVLVAASPCALAIATPSAVLSGVARAARGGVLVKGGAALENLGQLQSIAFDKTGTLTTGHPQVTEIQTFGKTNESQANEDQLMRYAVAVERRSDHPLARAVVEAFESAGGELGSIPQAVQLKSITGKGVEAIVDGKRVRVGKRTMFELSSENARLVDDLEQKGRTTMLVQVDGELLGALALLDTPREGAREMITRLRKLGIERMVMISGDNQQVASEVAGQVGLDKAFGDLLPDDKVATIQTLLKSGGVAMVGDGVNDAPAMATATIGIAMGAAGSDVALETADVALMADRLEHLPFAVGLSRQTNRIIRQNLWYSLGMVAVLVPATILGLNIGLAVFFHEGSTVFVVFNALRLLIYQGNEGNS